MFVVRYDESLSIPRGRPCLSALQGVWKVISPRQIQTSYKGYFGNLADDLLGSSCLWVGEILQLGASMPPALDFYLPSPPMVIPCPIGTGTVIRERIGCGAPLRRNPIIAIGIAPIALLRES